MIRRRVLSGLTALGACLALLGSPTVSQAFWPFHHSTTAGYCPTCPTTVGYAPYAAYYTPYSVGYVPTTAYYGSYRAAYAPACSTCSTGYTAAYAPSACNTCYTPAVSQCCNYVPQTCYRTVYTSVPVTTYRPIITTDPCTGCTHTAYQPITSCAMQPRLVPYTSYYPACGGGCAPATCGTCNTCNSCSTGTSAGYYAPSISSGCSSCTGSTTVVPGSTIRSLTPAPTQSIPSSSTIINPGPVESEIRTAPRGQTFRDHEESGTIDEESRLRPIPNESTQKTRTTNSPKLFDPQDRQTKLPARGAAKYQKVSLKETDENRPLDNSHWRSASR